MSDAGSGYGTPLGAAQVANAAVIAGESPSVFEGTPAVVGGAVQHDQAWLALASPEDIVEAHALGQLVDLGAPASRTYQSGSIQSVGR